jgi:hypothetical protein
VVTNNIIILIPINNLKSLVIVMNMANNNSLDEFSGSTAIMVSHLIYSMFTGMMLFFISIQINEKQL